MVDRLDEERTAILRAWGARLAADTRPELRAAGKAITILIEEIDRLQVDVGRAQDTVSRPLVEAINRQVKREPVEAESSQSLGSSLRERLSAVIPNGATYDREE